MIDEITQTLGLDNNQKNLLLNSKLKDITEYGRVVHAEMEAIIGCARNGSSTIGTTLYCTTFPCHNCAKHIIAAGISKVVYIEPYSKSKALPFHLDSVIDEEENTIHEILNTLFETSDNIIKPAINTSQHTKVRFESFAGIGPRLFRQLFTMRPDSRKDINGLVKKDWQPQLITIT